MNNPDHISQSLETIFFCVKIPKFFDEDPVSGMEKSRIRDREKHPGSATLFFLSQHKILYETANKKAPHTDFKGFSEVP